jgi:hypothetical protein
MAVLDRAIDVVPGTDLVLVFTRYAGTQLLTMVGTPTGGTFTATYRGATTSAVAYNASAATLQTALEALSTIKAGNVAVSGSAGGPWTVTPQGQLSAVDFFANLITINGSALTGGTSPHVVVTTPVLDLTTGYTYAFQARDSAGELTPDIQIDATHTTQGSIVTGGAAGTITVTINRATTAALIFPTATGSVANFVLVEIHSSLYTPLIEGQLRLKGAYFV